MPIPEFLVLANLSEGVTLVNLAQVRMVRFEEGTCKLFFSETHVVNVSGKGAAELFSSIVDHSYLTSEEPATLLASEVKARIRAANEDPGAEP